MYNAAAANAGFYNNRQHNKFTRQGQVVYEMGAPMPSTPNTVGSTEVQPSTSVSTAAAATVRESFDPDAAREATNNTNTAAAAVDTPEQSWWNAMNDDNRSSQAPRWSQESFEL